MSLCKTCGWTDVLKTHRLLKEPPNRNGFSTSDAGEAAYS